MQNANQQNAIDAGRYWALRTLALATDEQTIKIEAYCGTHEMPTTPEDADAQVDALIIAIHKVFADEIQGDAIQPAPPAFLEIDPTHVQQCCGKCRNVPPEEGWGEADGVAV